MKFFRNKKISRFWKNGILALFLVVVLGGVFGPEISVAQTFEQCIAAGGTATNCAVAGTGNVNVNSTRTNNPAPPTSGELASNVFSGLTSLASDYIVAPVFKFIGYILQLISSRILGLSGYLFDTVIKFSILETSENLQGENGIGTSIEVTWGTLRDIANMFFIFVLLFTAFKSMFQLGSGNVGKSIINIIIVALLINFSLFFTKVVIDASNVVAIGFYNSILNTKSVATEATEGTREATQNSISTGYMNLLGLQKWYDPALLTSKGMGTEQILITGLMSSLFMLVAAVIMFIASIMFITRWVLLALLMILSPVAFIAIIVPGMSGQFDKWKNAVIDQSFFAPLYFAMTWVAFKVAVGYRQTAGGALTGEAWSNVGIGIPNDNAMTLVLNYFLVIGFSIAALIFAKQMASKTAGFTTITGGIGAGVAGGSAWLGRSAAGAGGNWLANKMQAAKGSDNFFKRSGARLLSYTGEKAAKSSFDIRNASVPTSVVGDAIKGTVGRTGLGKKLGLDDVNIPSIDVGNKLGGGIVGTAEKKGYAERKAESDKRVRERESQEASKIKLAGATNDIVAGAKAPAGTTGPVIDAMEKSLSSLSDKETETLVASNRELLESQNFANKISVKQLEAIIKSDQFSEEDKDKIKNARFAEITDINDAAGLAAIARRSTGATLTPTEAAAAAKVEKARTRVKALADSELEMLDPNYLDPSRPEGREFISQLRGAQADNIISNKSGKFTGTQRERVKTERLRPLTDAIRTGRSTDAQNIVRKADVKTKVSYMKTDGPGIPPIKIGLDPNILPVYVPKILQRMAAHDDMTDDEIHNLRLALLGPAGTGAPGVDPATVTWLLDPNKGGTDFP